MSSPDPSSAYREYPVVFPAGRETIGGIFTEPTGAGRGVVVVLLTGAFLPMTHRNRMWVQLARRLAGEGFSVLRFDYHGVGESTGTIAEWSLDKPFAEDLEGAVRWLRSRHASRIAMVGSCLGARTILACAERVPELTTAVFLSAPLRGHRIGEYAADRLASSLTLLEYIRRASRVRVVRRLFDAEWRAAYLRILRVKLRRSVDRATSAGSPGGADGLHWVSRKFLDPLRQLAHRRIPLLFLFGAQEEYYDEFRTALGGRLGVIVRAAGDSIQVRTTEGVLHNFSTLEAQEAAIRHTFEWICTAPRSAPAARDDAMGVPSGPPGHVTVTGGAEGY